MNVEYPPENGTLSVAAQIESLLFVAGEPVSLGRLASLLDLPISAIDNAVAELAQEYRHRGVRLQRYGNELQLTSAPEAAELIDRFLGLERNVRLTRPAIEVLAVVAFLQPVTRPRIEEIRGVNSDSSLQTLMNLGLIEEIGRSDSPGRPFLYATTSDFLRYFGLNSLAELPQSLLEEEE